MQVETFKKMSSELTPYSDNKHNAQDFRVGIGLRSHTCKQIFHFSYMWGDKFGEIQ